MRQVTQTKKGLRQKLPRRSQRHEGPEDSDRSLSNAPWAKRWRCALGKGRRERRRETESPKDQGPIIPRDQESEGRSLPGSSPRRLTHYSQHPCDPCHRDLSHRGELGDSFYKDTVVDPLDPTPKCPWDKERGLVHDLPDTRPGVGPFILLVVPLVLNRKICFTHHVLGNPSSKRACGLFPLHTSLISAFMLGAPKGTWKEDAPATGTLDSPLCGDPYGPFKGGAPFRFPIMACYTFPSLPSLLWKKGKGHEKKDMINEGVLITGTIDFPSMHRR
ncbi:conserved hypothetical protein [Ricinus communis]|uniref:Uncharacterized protein n=1 Tax=Ricinus communis TaxID=3988 RepID=B9T992_RICCO|nr:conserved hypothetical protein [Ricinus communis]